MFRWLVGSSLKFRFMVLLIAAGLIVFGSTQLKKMPIDVFPEFAAPTVEVQTEAIGLSAKEVERLVTLNLEELLSGVPWLDSISSESVTGLSSIKLVFDRGTDLIKARQMVQERLALSIFLPNVASPPVIIQPRSTTNRFMMVAISSDQVEETDLSMIARWTIQPKLTGVQGVSNVAIWGQRLKQLQVHLDPERLRDARITQDDVIATSGDALWMSPLTFLKGSTPGTGGWIDYPEQRLGIQHDMPIVTPEDMSKLPVTPPHLLLTGKQMALGDVSEVTYSHPPLIGDAFVNGGKGLLLMLEKFPNANTLEVTAGVEEALKELRRGLPGVTIDASVFQLSAYIEDSISNLVWAMIIGLVLVVLAVGALLFNWRSALVSLISIPLSLLAAVVVLHLTGTTMNTMVLAGLLVALGVVIDDAVVYSHQLMERLRNRKVADDKTVATIVYETTIETRSTATYAALIVLLAVLPVVFLGGVSGAFFQPMALSYALAVIASMIVGLTVTPALSRLILKEETDVGDESGLAGSLGTVYGGLLQPFLKGPQMAMIVAAVLVLVGVGTWPFLGQSLMPSFKESEVLVNWSTPPGTSYEETYRITSRVSDELETLPGVRGVGAHIGRAVTGDQVVGINNSQIWVGLDDGADFDEMADTIREVVDGYPGVEGSVQSYLRDNVGIELTGSANPVVVRVYGQERGILLEQAERIRESLSSVNGLVDLRVDGQIEEPQIRVKVDMEKAAANNVKPGEIRRSAATVFSGLTVGFIFEDSKIYDVVVWSAPEARNSLSALNNVLVEKSDRHHVRLGDVAEASIDMVPTVIKHHAIAPYVDVVANVDGRDLGTIGNEIEAKLDGMEFPLEYHPELLGEVVEQESARERIFGLTIASLIGIFLLLQACFGSWRLAFIGFLALPAAAAGGALATLASGGVITLGSIVGFFAVLGIAARHGVFLINHCQNLERNMGVEFGAELVARAARDRMLPILVSSLAMILALLPVLFMGAVPGLEIARPTAVVVIGGVIVSTLFTLLILPALYLSIGAKADRRADIGLATA
ncbi:MAG: efflux RND transporter permease subunit [Geminicoccaceae bacterium]